MGIHNEVSQEIIDYSDSWIDRHSVNCFWCENLVDERNCIANPDEDEGGDICLKCQDNICPRCESNEIVIDDYGIVLCGDCYNNDEQAQNHASAGISKEKQMFGYE